MRARRLSRLALVLILTIGVVEVCTWLLFEPLTGAPFSYADLAAARATRIAAIDAQLGGEGSSPGTAGFKNGSASAAGAVATPSAGGADTAEDGAPAETGGTDTAEDGAPAEADDADDRRKLGLVRFHPYLGYTGRPGAHPWGDTLAPYNDFGFFSISRRPYPFRGQVGDLVIGVAGGSVAEIFANRAEPMLQAALDDLGVGRRVVLIALGTGGYKQPQQLYAVEYALLAGFNFDLVLNLDGYNDVVLAAANADDGIHPLYPSGYHTAMLARLAQHRLDPAIIESLADTYRAYRAERTVLSWIGTWPYRRSVFLNALAAEYSAYSQRRIEALQYAMVGQALAGADDALRGPPFHAEDVYAAAADAWAASSRMLHAALRERGIPYVHVLQPNQYVEGSKPLTEHERATAYAPDYDWSRHARQGYPYLIRAGQALAAEGEPYYDLTMVFAGVNEDLYIDVCCHFNPRGNEILARAIAPAIARAVAPAAVSPTATPRSSEATR